MSTEQITNTSDPTYNLVSVLYHALQGAETDTRYAADAERAGDSELAEFFRRAQEADRDVATQAKGLLRERLAG
jgi:hypothetical protein